MWKHKFSEVTDTREHDIFWGRTFGDHLEYSKE
jgi:hypothetical protein